MQTATLWSRLSRVSATALVLTVPPLAALAQGSEPPNAVREFSSTLPVSALVISPKVGKAFNEAITAVNASRFEAARDAMGELRLDRLNAYERGKAEQVLFNIAWAEKNYAEARQHLINAIESRGLNAHEIEAAQEQIERIDARLATAPTA